jgi:hypothetical protein
VNDKEEELDFHRNPFRQEGRTYITFYMDWRFFTWFIFTFQENLSSARPQRAQKLLGRISDPAFLRADLDHNHLLDLFYLGLSHNLSTVAWKGQSWAVAAKLCVGPYSSKSLMFCAGLAGMPEIWKHLVQSRTGKRHFETVKRDAEWLFSDIH